PMPALLPPPRQRGHQGTKHSCTRRGWPPTASRSHRAWRSRAIVVHSLRVAAPRSFLREGVTVALVTAAPSNRTTRKLDPTRWSTSVPTTTSPRTSRRPSASPTSRPELLACRGLPRGGTAVLPDRPREVL